MRGRSSSKALTESMKRAAAAEQIEKDHAARRQRIKEKGDFGAALEGLDLTPQQEEEMIAKYLYSRHIEPKQLTDDQRALRDLQKRAEAAESKLKAEEDTRSKAESLRVAKQEAASLETEILEAAKAGRIPGDKAAIRRIAAKMEMLESKGMRLPIEQVAAVVRDDVGRETGEFVASASLEELKDLWGDAVFKTHARKMRDYLLAQLKPGPTGPTIKARPDPTQRPKGPMTPQQFLEITRKR
jgi:hypothetical protein